MACYLRVKQELFGIAIVGWRGSPEFGLIRRKVSFGADALRSCLPVEDLLANGHSVLTAYVSPGGQAQIRFRNLRPVTADDR
jgi:hypothetical protein